jgi:D-ribose pyranase
LKLLSSELEVEEFYVAEEGNAINKSKYLAVEKIFPHASKISIPHSSLKEKVKGAKAVIRTGDFSPYSNVILSSGVSFSNYSSIISEA